MFRFIYEFLIGLREALKIACCALLVLAPIAYVLAKYPWHLYFSLMSLFFIYGCVRMGRNF